MENQEQQYKRRVRYKVSTPAGMHISICINEILDFLKIRPGEVCLDATLGYKIPNEILLRKINKY